MAEQSSAVQPDRRSQSPTFDHNFHGPNPITGWCSPPRIGNHVKGIRTRASLDNTPDQSEPRGVITGSATANRQTTTDKASQPPMQETFRMSLYERKIQIESTGQMAGDKVRCQSQCSSTMGRKPSPPSQSTICASWQNRLYGVGHPEVETDMKCQCWGRPAEAKFRTFCNGSEVICFEIPRPETQFRPCTGAGFQSFPSFPTNRQHSSTLPECVPLQGYNVTDKRFDTFLMKPYLCSMPTKPSKEAALPHPFHRTDSEPSICNLKAKPPIPFRSQSLPMRGPVCFTEPRCPYAVTHIYQPPVVSAGNETEQKGEQCGHYETFYHYNSDSEVYFPRTTGAGMVRRFTWEGNKSMKISSSRAQRELLRSISPDPPKKNKHSSRAVASPSRLPKKNYASALSPQPRGAPETFPDQSRPAQPIVRVTDQVPPPRPGLSHSRTVSSKTSERLARPVPLGLPSDSDNTLTKSEPATKPISWATHLPNFPNTDVPRSTHSPAPEYSEKQSSLRKSPKAATAVRAIETIGKAVTRAPHTKERKPLPVLSQAPADSSVTASRSEYIELPLQAIAAVLSAQPLYHWGSLVLPHTHRGPRIRLPPEEIRAQRTESTHSHTNEFSSRSPSTLTSSTPEPNRDPPSKDNIDKSFTRTPPSAERTQSSPESPDAPQEAELHYLHVEPSKQTPIMNTPLSITTHPKQLPYASPQLSISDSSMIDWVPTSTDDISGSSTNISANSEEKWSSHTVPVTSVRPKSIHSSTESHQPASQVSGSRVVPIDMKKPSTLHDAMVTEPPEVDRLSTPGDNAFSSSKSTSPYSGSIRLSPLSSTTLSGSEIVQQPVTLLKLSPSGGTPQDSSIQLRQQPYASPQRSKVTTPVVAQEPIPIEDAGSSHTNHENLSESTIISKDGSPSPKESGFYSHSEATTPSNTTPIPTPSAGRNKRYSPHHVPTCRWSVEEEEALPSGYPGLPSADQHRTYGTSFPLLASMESISRNKSITRKMAPTAPEVPKLTPNHTPQTLPKPPISGPATCVSRSRLVAGKLPAYGIIGPIKVPSLVTESPMKLLSVQSPPLLSVKESSPSSFSRSSAKLKFAEGMQPPLTILGRISSSPLKVSETTFSGNMVSVEDNLIQNADTLSSSSTSPRSSSQPTFNTFLLPAHKDIITTEPSPEYVQEKLTELQSLESTHSWPSETPSRTPSLRHSKGSEPEASSRKEPEERLASTKKPTADLVGTSLPHSLISTSTRTLTKKTGPCQLLIQPLEEEDESFLNYPGVPSVDAHRLHGASALAHPDLMAQSVETHKVRALKPPDVHESPGPVRKSRSGDHRKVSGGGKINEKSTVNSTSDRNRNRPFQSTHHSKFNRPETEYGGVRSERNESYQPITSKLPPLETTNGADPVHVSRKLEFRHSEEEKRLLHTKSRELTPVASTGNIAVEPTFINTPKEPARTVDLLRLTSETQASKRSLLKDTSKQEGPQKLHPPLHQLPSLSLTEHLSDRVSGNIGSSKVNKRREQSRSEGDKPNQRARSGTTEGVSSLKSMQRSSSSSMDRPSSDAGPSGYPAGSIKEKIARCFSFRRERAPTTGIAAHELFATTITHTTPRSSVRSSLGGTSKALSIYDATQKPLNADSEELKRSGRRSSNWKSLELTLPEKNRLRPSVVQNTDSIHRMVKSKPNIIHSIASSEVVDDSNEWVYRETSAQKSLDTGTDEDLLVSETLRLSKASVGTTASQSAPRVRSSHTLRKSSKFGKAQSVTRAIRKRSFDSNESHASIIGSKRTVSVRSPTSVSIRVLDSNATDDLLSDKLLLTDAVTSGSVQSSPDFVPDWDDSLLSSDLSVEHDSVRVIKRRSYGPGWCVDLARRLFPSMDAITIGGTRIQSSLNSGQTHEFLSASRRFTLGIQNELVPSSSISIGVQGIQPRPIADHPYDTVNTEATTNMQFVRAYSTSTLDELTELDSGPRRSVSHKGELISPVTSLQASVRPRSQREFRSSLGDEVFKYPQQECGRKSTVEHIAGSIQTIYSTQRQYTLSDNYTLPLSTPSSIQPLEQNFRTTALGLARTSARQLCSRKVGSNFLEQHRVTQNKAQPSSMEGRLSPKPRTSYNEVISNAQHFDIVADQACRGESFDKTVPPLFKDAAATQTSQPPLTEEEQTGDTCTCGACCAELQQDVIIVTSNPCCTCDLPRGHGAFACPERAPSTLRSQYHPYCHHQVPQWTVGTPLGSVQTPRSVNVPLVTTVVIDGSGMYCLHETPDDVVYDRSGSNTGAEIVQSHPTVSPSIPNVNRYDKVDELQVGDIEANYLQREAEKTTDAAKMKGIRDILGKYVGHRRTSSGNSVEVSESWCEGVTPLADIKRLQKCDGNCSNVFDKRTSAEFSGWVSQVPNLPAINQCSSAAVNCDVSTVYYCQPTPFEKEGLDEHTASLSGAVKKRNWNRDICHSRCHSILDYSVETMNSSPRLKLRTYVRPCGIKSRNYAAMRSQLRRSVSRLGNSSVTGFRQGERCIDTGMKISSVFPPVTPTKLKCTQILLQGTKAGNVYERCVTPNKTADRRASRRQKSVTNKYDDEFLCSREDASRQTIPFCRNFSNPDPLVKSDRRCFQRPNGNNLYFDKQAVFVRGERIDVSPTEKSPLISVRTDHFQVDDSYRSLAPSEEPMKLTPRHKHYNPSRHGTVQAHVSSSNKVTPEGRKILHTIRDTIRLLMQDLNALERKMLNQDLRLCEAISEHLVLIPQMLTALLDHLHYSPAENELIRLASVMNTLVTEIALDPVMLLFRLIELGYRLNELAQILGEDLIPSYLPKTIHAIQSKLHRMKIGYVTRQYFHMPQTGDHLVACYSKSRQLLRLEEDCCCEVNLIHPEDPRAVYCPHGFRTIEVVYNEDGGKPELFERRLNHLINPKRPSLRLVATIVRQINGQELTMQPEDAKELLSCSVRPRYRDIRAIILSAGKHVN
ncbi:unnamed protein product [Dicrocoelium dendriticum]|nr:unnamed protein product [Dicrocoelium dendriticum]